MIGFIKFYILVLLSIIFIIIAILFFHLNYVFPFFHYIKKVWAYLILKISGIHIQVHGAHHIKKNTTYIFISNHASWLDIPTIMYAFSNKIKFIVKKEIIYVPIIGLAPWLDSHILVDRNKNYKKNLLIIKNKLIKLQKSSTSILIFPEGTRSPNGKILPFKKGLVFLASQLQLDMIPVSIFNSYTALPKKSFKISPCTIHVVIDPPVSRHNFNPSQKQQFIDSIRERIIHNYNLFRPTI